MALLEWLKSWLGGKSRGRSVAELALRLGVEESDLREIRPRYRSFTIPKRNGGSRWIQAPDRDLKKLQRRILRRLLARLPVHPAARGFERGESIVTNALPHAAKAIVVRMDVEDFFPSTRAERVRALFERLGWCREASQLLTSLCTDENALPQGAPTSPRLSNLVNRRLDARLQGVARKFGATYTRYADDLTFSFEDGDSRSPRKVIRITKKILADHGYRLHHKSKLHIRRRHQRQIVTGLVVNDRPQLPRTVRRWLRAVEHRASRSGGVPTLSPSQRDGWRALCSMVESQREPSGGR